MKKITIVFVSLVLLFTLFVGCQSGFTQEAEAPVINSVTSDAEIWQYDDILLSVDALSNDGGTLSYQWYITYDNKDNIGEVLDGATSSNYRPSTKDYGTFYFYCKVTNNLNGTSKSIKSKIITVRVKENIKDSDENKESIENKEPSSEEKTAEEKTSEAVEPEKEKKNSSKKSLVKFDFSGAKAVAQLEASKTETSRAAVDVYGFEDFVKILANGALENAITIEEGSSLASIKGVYKSPVENSEDVFVVFDGMSTIGSEVIEEELTDAWGYKYTNTTTKNNYIGQLICVHSDGTIADILKKDVVKEDMYWDYSINYLNLNTESLTFDASGNLYFIATNQRDKDGNWIDGGQVIYQFNPVTDALTMLVAEVENTSYLRMQISKDGEYIFASGSRNNSYFLRAIPISNPNTPVNIYYSSNWSIDSNKWAYDDENGIMYYLARNSNETAGLYIATLAGGFNDGKFIRSATITEQDDTSETETQESENVSSYRNHKHYTASDILDSFEVYYSNYYWGDSYLDDSKNFSANNILSELLTASGTFNSFDTETGNYYNKQLTKDNVDIKFDAYKNQTGPLKLLYLLTKGKKNEEALNALNNYYGMAALYRRDYDGYFNWKDKGRGYNHNFLADILYIKDTDILLQDSEDVILSYYELLSCSQEYNEETDTWSSKYEVQLVEKKGKDFFQRYEDGTYYDNYYLNIDSGKSESMNLAYDYKKTPAEILEWLFSYCNVDDEKEFRLTAFQNDTVYGALYTTLTDEEALNWLAEDYGRLSLFYKLLNENLQQESDLYDNEWHDYYIPISLVSKTCFIKGSDTSARITEKSEAETELAETPSTETIEAIPSIPYATNGSEWFNFYIGSECYNGYGSGSLSVTEDGVFYEFTNLYDSWYSSDSARPFYYIVELSYENGAMEESVTKVDLPVGKVAASQKVKNRVFMQYSLLNSSGAELGYHHIYSVDLTNGEIKNHFENVANRNTLEVVSFTVAERNLYFSAVRGTAVENQIVDIYTNECNPLATKRKMVAVYAF